MTAGKKPQVSAKEILSDIRSGMAHEELKRKYGLSDKGMESIFRKLAASGLVSETEARARSRKSADPAPAMQEPPKISQWNCPACNATHPEEAAECPACGVVVEKFLARRAEKTAAAELQRPARSSPWTRWLLAVGGSLIAALVIAAVLLWPRPGTREKPQPSVGIEKNLSRVEPGKKIEMKYFPEGYPLGLSVSQGSALHLFETPGAKPGFKKMPPDSGSKRYYDDFKIAGRSFLVITEQSTPPKIYLDANRNGDLTDDPGPFPGEKSDVVPNHYTLQLPYDGENEPTPYRMWMFVSGMGGTAFYPQCHWARQIVVVGNIYHVVLFDGNADGYYANDPVVIDVNNDGKAEKSEQLSPGESIEVDGAVIKLISIAPSGRWIRLDY